MRSWLGASFVVAAAAALVACGGGGGSTAAPPVPTATPVVLPSIAAIAVPTANSSSTQVLGATVDPVTGQTVTPAPVTAPDGSQVIPVPLPSDTSKIGGTFAIPASAVIQPGTTVTQGLSSTPGAGVPPLFHTRTVKDATSRLPLLFISTQSSNDVTLPVGPTIQINFPLPLPSNLSYFVAFYDPLRPSLGWQYGYEGPGTLNVSGASSLLSFKANPSPLVLVAFTRYYFAVFAESQAAPSPTPAPVGVPTTAPSPTPAPIVASPATLQFGAIGVAGATTLNLSEAGYSGTFTATTPDCGSGSSAIATIAGSGSSFTVTPVSPGSCRLLVAGDRGRSLIVPVTVSSSAIAVTIPGATATPGPSPVPFSVPASLAVSTGGSTTLTVNAGAVTSGPVLASVGDVTVARITPTVWTSPLPAIFTVTGVGPGTTNVTVSDGAAFTPGLHTVTIPVTVGAVGGSITVPGFPSPSPFPLAPIVSPAQVTVPVVAGTSMAFSVTGGSPGYSGPIYAVVSSPYFLSVTPNVWTSPLPAVFTVNALIGPNPYGGVSFFDNQGAQRFVQVPVAIPSPAMSAAPSALTFTSKGQFLPLAISEKYVNAQIYGAVCSGSFAFSSSTSWPSVSATAPPNMTFAVGYAPTAQFFIQATATGSKTCTATFYDLTNNVTKTVPLQGPP